MVIFDSSIHIGTPHGPIFYLYSLINTIGFSKIFIHLIGFSHLATLPCMYNIYINHD